MSTLRIDEHLVIQGVQDVTRSNTDRFPDVALQVGGFALSSDGKILYVCRPMAATPGWGTVGVRGHGTTHVCPVGAW